MKHAVILGLSILALDAGLSRAQAVDTCVVWTSTIQADPNKSLGQLQYEAVSRQRNNVLALLGTRVSSTTEMSTVAVGDSVSRVMQQGIAQETVGTISHDSTLDWRTIDGGRTWQLKWSGCGHVSAERPDLSFTITAKLDKNPPNYAYGGTAKDLRDSLVVYAKSSQPAYFTVFEHTEDDSVAVVYPSAAALSPTRVLVPKGDSLRVPPAGARVRVNLEPAQTMSHPMIIVVATKSDIPLNMGRDRSQKLSKVSWQDYLNWYNAIPANQKVSARLPYAIERVRR